MEVRSRACMAAVDPKVCVQLTVVEGDRVVQVTRNKMKPLAHDVKERVSNVGVPVTETAWSLTNQSKATSKEGSNRIARAMTSNKNPQIRSHMSRAEKVQ